MSWFYHRLYVSPKESQLLRNMFSISKDMGYLISLSKYSFKAVKVGLDVANGAAWQIAKSIFDALGAKTYVMNDNPDGYNINTDCGSTHIEHLQRFVVENALDVGFAYDGDADRCLCVDEKWKTKMWVFYFSLCCLSFQKEPNAFCSV